MDANAVYWTTLWGDTVGKGIAVDANAVYWVSMDSVMKVGLSGGAPSAVFPGQGGGHIAIDANAVSQNGRRGIAVDGNAVYWANVDRLAAS